MCTQAGYCGIANILQLHGGALVLRSDFRCHLFSKPQNACILFFWFFFSAGVGCVMWMNTHALLLKIK